MKKILFSLIIIVGYLGCYNDSEINALAINQIYSNGLGVPGCIVFDGDSNTDFISIEAYIPNGWNIAIAGSGTDAVIQRIEMVRCSAPSQIVLMVGTWDTTDYLMGRSGIERFYENYQHILDEYKTIVPANKIICISILPITVMEYNQRFGMNLPADRNERVEEINQQLKLLVEGNGCRFVDEWRDFYDGGIRPEYNLDYIHLNDAGQKKHMENIMSVFNINEEEK